MNIINAGNESLLILVLLAVTSLPFARADETTKEAIDARAKDAKRSMKKGGHRLREAVVCAQDDVKCLEEKAKNRANEAVDATKDKAEELNNKAD